MFLREPAMMQHMMDVGMMWDMGLGGVRVMSVSPLKADFHRPALHIRSVPQADRPPLQLNQFPR